MTRNIFLSASLPEGASVTITKSITKTIDEVVEEWIVGKECRLIWGGHPTIVPMLREALAKHGLRMS